MLWIHSLLLRLQVVLIDITETYKRNTEALCVCSMNDFSPPESGYSGGGGGGGGGGMRAAGQDGGILVITDPPPSIEFGVDTTSYTTGHKFQGMSCIPPGVHFCYYSMGMSPRQGFFFNIKAPSAPLATPATAPSAHVTSDAGACMLVVRSYEPQNEQILPYSLLTGSCVCVSCVRECISYHAIYPASSLH